MKNLLTFIILLFSVLVISVTRADDRFTLDANGQEVIDNDTGLIWRRCAEGMTWDGKKCAGSYSMFSHEQAFQHATDEAKKTGQIWRLPNLNELFSIVDTDQYYAAVNKTAFPNTPPQPFWTSTPYTGIEEIAWGVHFSIGDTAFSHRSVPKLVRLVRDQ